MANRIVTCFNRYRDRPDAYYSSILDHGVIALATAAVELGWIVRTSPETRVGIDAPCGFIEAFVRWDGEHAGNVQTHDLQRC